MHAPSIVKTNYDGTFSNGNKSWAFFQCVLRAADKTQILLDSLKLDQVLNRPNTVNNTKETELYFTEIWRPSLTAISPELMQKKNKIKK